MFPEPSSGTCALQGNCHKVLLVIGSRPIQDVVQDILLSAGVEVEFAPFLPTHLDAINSGIATVVCTSDVDWRSMIHWSRGQVPVILLMQRVDPQLWSEAFMAGAFDALTLHISGSALLQSVGKAVTLRNRKLLVQESPAQNPLASQSPTSTSD